MFDAAEFPPSAAPGRRLGFDLACVSDVACALTRFGARYLDRVYTPAEQAYAFEARGAAACERLAARFAAKEAAMKALSLPEAGVGWRDIEVVKAPDGSCRLALHGRARERANALGARDLLVCLSHDRGHAAAVVTATLSRPAQEHEPQDLGP